MKKPEAIEAAKAAGVVRTEKQFAALKNEEIQALTAEYTAMSDEDKKVANEIAAEEAAKSEEDENKKAEAAKKEQNKNVSEKVAADVKSLFTSYPSLKTAFSTTDGTVFLSKNPAENHELTLSGNKSKVKEHPRD